MEVKNIGELEKDFSDHVNARLAAGSTLLLLSGGSLFDRLEDLLSNINKTNLENLMITVVDERWDNNVDHINSNFRQLQDLPVIRNLVADGATLKQFLVSGLDLVATAEVMTKYINSFEGSFVSILGMGSDGHIAGILPHAADKFTMFDVDSYVGYDINVDATSNNPFPYRITPGFQLLKKIARNGFLVITGEGKKPMLRDLLNEDAPYYEFPAQVAKDIEGLAIYTDLNINS